ncbi:MFS transporter [Actinoplanes sp. N902-109]|uniref:MFS transporter n=1 Tax=Actinoplanes sp. (strain N902-109) TaxID=649831 RepID=UPI0003295C35|nr:MFS transporter [Actinoplanes sp. N902-109]AGL20652.1 hypothetical protein L083_7142 [Actinoplanes sp. N902-109]
MSHIETASRTPQRAMPEHRGYLAVGFLTLLIVGTDLFVVSPLLPAMSRDYGVSTAAAGNSVTVFSIVYVIGAPWFGTLADRFGRRSVLVAGLAVFAVANLLTGLAPTFAVLMAARVLAGIAAAAVSPSVYALIGQTAPPARRGVWMSTVVAGFLISLVTGAPIGTLAAAAFGWRAAFVGLALLTAILVAVNAVAWRDAPAAPPVAAGDRLPVTVKVRAVSVTGLWAFAVYSLYTYLGTGLREEAGLPTGMVATALVIYGVGAVVGSLSGGRLADRFGARRVATTGLLVLSVLLLALAAAIHAPAPVLLVLLCLFAVAAYPCLPSYQAQLVSSFPAQAGSILAWNSSVMYLGTSLGAAAGSVLLAGAGFRAIPLVAAAVGLIGALVCGRFAISSARLT